MNLAQILYIIILALTKLGQARKDGADWLLVGRCLRPIGHHIPECSENVYFLAHMLHNIGKFC